MAAGAPRRHAQQDLRLAALQRLRPWNLAYYTSWVVCCQVAWYGA